MKAIETDLQDSLPKILKGTVQEQRVRCGKKGCRCARGELHTAYYRFWRGREGKQHKEYIPKRDVERVRAACAEWQKMDEAMDKLKKGADAKRIKKEFRASLRRAGLPPEIVRQFR